MTTMDSVLQAVTVTLVQPQRGSFQRHIQRAQITEKQCDTYPSGYHYHKRSLKRSGCRFQICMSGF